VRKTKAKRKEEKKEKKKENGGSDKIPVPVSLIDAC
jgi:hypothetical protein